MYKLSIIFICINLLLPPATSYASFKNTFRPYFAAGKKSQTDNIEERDLSGSFDYYKYGFSSSFKIDESLSLKIGFQEYNKDFLSNSQPDVDTYIYKIGTSFLLSENDASSLNANLDFSLRNKRYEDSSDSDYDQIKANGGLKYKIKDKFSLRLSGGINDYEYTNNTDKDVLKTFLKISPTVYLFDKFLEMGGFCKVRWLDTSGNNKNTAETILSGNTTLNLRNELFEKIKGHIETGKENTQDTEDREDFIRYKYTLWDITTYHKFNKKLKTQLRYGQKQRDYLTDNSDYENWYITNNTTFKLLEKEPFNLGLFIKSEHKETDFNKIHKNSYIKNKIAFGLSFLKRANWSLKPEFSLTHYNYTSESMSDEKSYKAKISAKKYISKDFTLGGYYWYKWKDYKFKSDSEQWTTNLSLTLKF